MDVQTLLEHRAAKDEFFRTSPNSPLDPPHRDDFPGLVYYEPNPEAAFTLPVDGDVERGPIKIQMSDGLTRTYQRAGKVHFDIDGVPATLTLFSSNHPGYFVPFRDATSGKETYGGGRYLDVTPNADGTVTIDFNLAYNPFCAYSTMYTCPLPPLENWLEVPIAAGELAYERGASEPGDD